MTTSWRRAILLMLAALGTASMLSPSASAARSNPYSAIVDRNAFGLKPPPPPVVETNQAPATPPAKVVLTGITSMFGPSSKRVFLEITEQEAGKPGKPSTPKRPMLGEGDREGDIEVLSIDIERSIVRIRNGTEESELTFEVPKPGSSPSPAGAMANVPVVNPPAAATQNQPIIISSSEPRGGVTMAGGGSAFAGNSSGVTTYGGNSAMSSGTSGGISTFGGVSPMGAVGGSSRGPVSSTGLPSIGGAPGGLATIPSRTIRTPSSVPQIDPATQEILMRANEIHRQQTAPPVPPELRQRFPDLGRTPPPSPLSKLDEMQGGGGPR